MATGHLEKRYKSSWTIVIDTGRDENGKRIRIIKSIKGPKRDAEKEMRKMLYEIENGTYVEPNKLTVAEYLQQWLESKKPNVAPRTYESYEMIISTHLIPSLGHINLSKLQPLAVEQYKNEKLKAKKSNRTVQYHLSILNQAMKAAVRLRLISYNPVEAVDKPRVQKRPAKFLTPKQVDILLEAAKGKREYPAIFFALHTGMRLGEVLGLLWENVNLNEKIIHVRKQLQYIKGVGIELQDILKTSSSYRTITISSEVIALLKSLSKISDYVFCIPKGPHAGKPYDPTNFDNRFKEIIAETGLNITPHSLRHTHASLLLAAGEQLNVVQERLGHERASTTSDIYAHVLPNSQKKSAELFEQILKTEKKNNEEQEK